MTDRPAPGYTPARGEAKFPDLTLHKRGIAAPILGAIFGRLPGDRGGVEPLHPITRLVVGLVGFGLLYSLVVPWL